jgi:hypothetical protein
VSTWTPSAYKPAKHIPTACAPGDLAAYDAACFNDKTRGDAACAQFRTTKATCAACLESNPADSSWGPVVQYDNGPSLNGPGCFELYDGNVTCATSLQETALCEHQACDAVCPVIDELSYDQWLHCTLTAAGGSCSTYNTGSAKCNDDVPGRTFCWRGETRDDFFMNIAPLFCGGADTDGGSPDGSSDASLD